MPDIVYCDNKDCCCYDDYRERCDAYRLVIEHGVCTGSPRHGRNVSENDLDERLKEENVKLRELVRDFALLTDDVVSHWGIELEAGNSTEAPPAEWKECLYELDMLVSRMHGLGIEVD